MIFITKRKKIIRIGDGESYTIVSTKDEETPVGELRQKELKSGMRITTHGRNKYQTEDLSQIVKEVQEVAEEKYSIELEFIRDLTCTFTLGTYSKKRAIEVVNEIIEVISNKDKLENRGLDKYMVFTMPQA